MVCVHSISDERPSWPMTDPRASNVIHSSYPTLPSRSYHNRELVDDDDDDDIVISCFLPVTKKKNDKIKANLKSPEIR